MYIYIYIYIYICLRGSFTFFCNEKYVVCLRKIKGYKPIWP